MHGSTIGFDSIVRSERDAGLRLGETERGVMMEVILLGKVQRLGGLGDKVSVKAGFARNYLIPKGIAVAATPRNVAEFESRREELERREAQTLAAAGNRATALEGVEITVSRKAGEGGRLFGSVGPADIVQVLADAGHDIARQEVRMPDGDTIRWIGEYDVTIHISAEVEATIRLAVVPESAAGAD